MNDWPHAARVGWGARAFAQREGLTAAGRLGSLTMLSKAVAISGTAFGGAFDQGPQGAQTRYPEGPPSTSMAVLQHVALVTQSVSR